MAQKQAAVLQLDLSPLAPFIEKEKELTKAELLRRTAGKVNELILQHLKQFQFCRIGKNENGSLYLL